MTTDFNSPLHSPTSPWEDYEPKTRLNDLQDFCVAGVPPAIHDAWVLIIDNNLAVPPWLAVPTKAVIARGLSTKKVPYQRKMKHYYRWRKVKELLSKGIKRKDVFVAASKALLGTQYYCSDATFEESYELVRKALSDATEALQYYTAMKETRYLTGTSLKR